MYLHCCCLIAGRWWSSSALWPGWQGKQVPALDVQGQSRRKRRVWSVPVISPPSLLLFPCVGIIWCRGTIVSPHFSAPSSPGAFPPVLPAQRVAARGSPREPLGLSLPPLPLSRGAEGTGPSALPLFQKALAALALSSLGAAGGGAAAGADGPCWRVWGLLASRLRGGSPFTTRLGEGWLPLTWSVPS